MSSAGDGLLIRALRPDVLLGELERAATAWEVETDRPRRRPSCGLCLADRAWIAEAPMLASLPHAVSHPVVARVDAALQAAEFQAREHAEEDAWMHIRAYETIGDEIAASMREFDERARETVLTILDGIEPAIARVRDSVVEPVLARYLDRHSMTEPPWPWTLE